MIQAKIKQVLINILFIVLAFTVQNWLEAELRAVNAPLYNRCKYKIRQTKPKKCR